LQRVIALGGGGEIFDIEARLPSGVATFGGKVLTERRGSADLLEGPLAGNRNETTQVRLVDDLADAKIGQIEESIRRRGGEP